MQHIPDQVLGPPGYAAPTKFLSFAPVLFMVSRGRAPGAKVGCSTISPV